jgi:DNA-directed RNA polymerase beta' subunit
MSGRVKFLKQTPKPSAPDKPENVEEFDVANLPEVIIDQISFKLASFEDMIRDSVCEVTTKVTTVTSVQRDGLDSPKMGTVDAKTLCVTCHQNVMKCIGHFGFIRLPEPIPHPTYIRKIIKVLNSVCGGCGGLILSNEAIKSYGILNYSGDTRLNELEVHSKGKLCYNSSNNAPVCSRNPTYDAKKSEDQGFIIYYTDDPDQPRRARTVNIMDILSKISDDDIKTMGMDLTRPYDMITQGIPVIPPRDRPTEEIEGDIYPNSLTNFYVEILKYVTILKSLKDRGSVDYSENLTYLVFYIKHFYDNADKLATRNNKVWKGIKEYIGTKKGLIRQNIQGKRGDQAGRTVLGPATHLKFGQIALSQEQASKLSHKVTVTQFNIKFLTDLIRRNKAHTIIPSTGPYKGNRIKILDRHRATIALVIGDEVERELMDGDFEPAGRQPTIHKESLMGFEIVIWNRRTMGLPLSYTTSMNADFDGDEGNLYVARSLETIAESRVIMNVRNCIMSSENNGPNFGLVMNSVLAASLLTYENPIIPKEIFNDAIFKITNTKDLPTLGTRLARYGIHPYSGYALFSALLPADFYYDKRTKSDPEKPVIKEGILISGFLTKSDIGVAQNSIIQFLAKKYGNERASDFLTDAPFVMTSWLEDTGFSVGYGDLFIRKTNRETGLEENICKTVAKEEIEKIKLIVDSYNTNVDNPLERERIESDIMAQLNNVTSIGTQLIDEKLPLTNRLGLMVMAGSKGSNYNISQIMAALSQQSIKGKRPPATVRRNDGPNVTTTYAAEVTPISSGLIEESFYEGLTPEGYAIHQIASREGLNDTASNTALIGSTNHRMMRALENISIHYDGTVRNSQNIIYQISYGEDNFNPAALQNVPGPYGAKVTSFIDVVTTFSSINSMFGFISA